MQCTQYTIDSIPSDVEDIYLSIVPISEETDCDDEGCKSISLTALLKRFSSTVEELTIVNPYTNIRLLGASVIDDMDNLFYLTIDSDSPVELESMTNCISLYEVQLHNCTFNIKDLPSSITTLSLNKCSVNLDQVATVLPNLYELSVKNTVLGDCPNLQGMNKLRVLTLENCSLNTVHPSVFDLGLEVLELVHDKDETLVLNGTLTSNNIDSIVLTGNIQMDSMVVENRSSNILIRKNSTITSLMTLNKGTELLDVRDCPNLKIKASDLYNNVDRVVVDSHKYLSAEDSYSIPIHIVTN